jgi:uncharacterized protein YukE
MSFKKFLIRLAIKILEQVLNVIYQQINRLQQEVVEQVENMVFQQMDDFWRGEDAEMFKSDVANALQEAAEIIGLTQRTCTGLERARDVIIRADQQASNLVSDLDRTFSRISSL